MADGKWIPDLTGDLPVHEAARHVLRVRLEVVGAYLPRVHRDDLTETESVHQLRVATRRAGAALCIFATCLGRKAAKGARRRMRAIRQAAGAARDWDVFRLNLLERRKRASEAVRIGHDFLFGYALGQRAAAQPRLEEVAHEYGPHFGGFVADTLGAVRAADGPDSRTLAELARPMVAELARALEEAGAGDHTDYAHLHQIRIAGKRLRYAMEVCGGCYHSDFKDNAYPLLEEMQEILGAANDSHVSAVRMGQLRDRFERAYPDEWEWVRPGVERLLAFHRRRLPRERQRFLALWERWKEVGTEERLTSLLLPSGIPAATPTA